MSQQDAEILQVLIGQMAKRGDASSIFRQAKANERKEKSAWRREPGRHYRSELCGEFCASWSAADAAIAGSGGTPGGKSTREGKKARRSTTRQPKSYKITSKE